MRPSVARQSEMPGPKVYSLWWGDRTIPKQKGVVEYTISAYRAKAAPHMLRNYLFNGYRRLSGELVFWLIPFGMGYGIYTWAKKTDAYHHSKAAHVAAGVEHD
ncbi:putative ucrQ family protein [Lyophyllum shimeji]|uniref:Cytochrome b-c1 complex subunit 8 n=1 Tax=Lyophyllum shimeji TaxID=47721 RepID=A0A9P3PU75_LYOSH|nr:putative ucrQ family protein [Lyophyllum shimeji]